jgi:VWFA-related protein
MSYLPLFPLAERAGRILLLFGVIGPIVGVRAQTPPSSTPPAQEKPSQDGPVQTDSTQAKPPASNSSETAEVSSRDAAPTFKVRVNLVLVHVVVRDAAGKVIQDLKKEDFQLFDNRKQQVISSFSVETPDSRAVAATTTATTPNAPDANETVQRAAVSLPKRFVAVMFDDQHFSMEDATFVRDAATRFLNSLAPSDRAGIYSTSGQTSQEFTNDHELLAKALLGILPRSPFAGFHDCPDISYYQADLIINKNDPQALAVATEDAVQCAFNGDETQITAAQGVANAAAARALNQGDADTEYAYRHMEEVMRRLSAMPGQRVLVFISPGFIESTLFVEANDIVDRATRANIVINTIDARGLYVPDVAGDIADPPHDSGRAAGFKATYRVAAQTAQEDVLWQFADGTGGTFFHNRNDVDEGLRQAGAAPAISYLLAFSPQNLKFDGRFHTLTVKLTRKTNYTIQARHGYYAPKHIEDPAEAAKQEIQEALFSQDEIRDLPVELQTQFFKMDATQAKLAVLTHVDIKGIHFRKAEGRNRDDLTVATAIFDENGNYVTGGEKIVEMKLFDKTYDRLSRSGLILKSSFDVKPGSYLVRQVVRDAEGAQLAAHNGAVVIPN